jgi:alpha-D-ribose 1-methylphosphonate 5-triphosphate synthase subunit PhnH
MAVSHPGQIYTITEPDATVAEHILLQKIAVCLIDHEVTFALSDQWKEGMSREIAQWTGSRQVDWDQADFIFVAGTTSQGRVGQVKRGTLAFPDRGATIIYCLDALLTDNTTGKASDRVRLSGPGIKTPRPPQLGGLDLAEYRLLRKVNDDYPLGVDIIVIKGDRYLMSLPRSTCIEVN